jgi:hypothetical protein
VVAIGFIVDPFSSFTFISEGGRLQGKSGYEVVFAT